MANKSIFEKVTQYRIKVEKDGKSVADVPGIFALPGLLMAPKLGIAGLVAAPFLGLRIRLENEDGEAVDVEGAVRKAADAVRESVNTAVETIREEVEKAREAVSDEDTVSGEKAENDDSAETGETVRDIAENPEKQEEEDVPTIEVKPEDSAKA